MKRVFVCIVLFIMSACQSEEKKPEYIVECPMPDCDDNPSLWMSAESCVTMLMDERFERCYVEPFKPNQNVQVGCQGQNCKKVGLVELLNTATSDEWLPDDGKLNKCFSKEKIFPYDLAEAVSRKQKLKKSEYTFVRDAYSETDVWFSECLEAMEKFLNAEPDERAKLFPVYTRLFSQHQEMEVSRNFVLYNRIEILLANIQLDITPTPYFFTRGQQVLGRHRLVEKAIVAIRDGGFNPEVFSDRLSINKLLQWRRRGIREFYAWWKHKWTDSDVRNRIREDLCSEVVQPWDYLKLGLTERQRESLKCDDLYDNNQTDYNNDGDPLTRSVTIKIRR